MQVSFSSSSLHLNFVEWICFSYLPICFVGYLIETLNMFRKKQPTLCMAKITLHKKKYWKQIKFWRTNTPILFPQINRVKNSPYCRWALVNHAVQWSRIRFSVQEYIEAHTWRQVQLPWMLDKQISLAGQGGRYILISFFFFLTDSSFTLKVFSKSEHHLPSCYWEETLLNNLLEPSVTFFFP